MPSLTPRRWKRKRWASTVVSAETVWLGQRSRPSAFAGSNERSSNPVKVEPQSILITLHCASREAKSPSQKHRTHQTPSKSTEGSSRTARACGITQPSESHLCSAVRPNPSLKLSTNGGPRRPSLAVRGTFSPAWACASHRRCQLSSNVRPPNKTPANHLRASGAEHVNTAHRWPQVVGEESYLLLFGSAARYHR